MVEAFKPSDVKTAVDVAESVGKLFKIIGP